MMQMNRQKNWISSLVIILLLSTFGISGTNSNVLTPDQIRKRDILLGKDKKTLADFLLEAETIIEIQEKENNSLKTAYSNQAGELTASIKESELELKIAKLEARERRVKQSGVVAAVSAVLTLTAVILFEGATTGWKFNISTSSLSRGYLIKF